jgi:hypothetical protein
VPAALHVEGAAAQPKPRVGWVEENSKDISPGRTAVYDWKFYPVHADSAKLTFRHPSERLRLTHRSDPDWENNPSWRTEDGVPTWHINFSETRRVTYVVKASKTAKIGSKLCHTFSVRAFGDGGTTRTKTKQCIKVVKRQ